MRLLESIGDRHRAIGPLAKHDALSKSWRLLVAEARQLKTLVHANAWSVLVTPKGHQLSGLWLHYGLRKCRHRIVHSQHAVHDRELMALAPWGDDAALALLHPESGLVQEIGWNPQDRLPPLRLRRQ